MTNQSIGIELTSLFCLKVLYIREQLFQGALKAYMQRAAVVSENFPFHVLIEMGMLNVISSM